MRIPRFTPQLQRNARILVLVLPAALGLQGCATFATDRPAPVTVRQVVRMSREGVPERQIIDHMRNSGTVYRLKASQLARLHERGVSNAVINYMQGSYLGAARRQQTLADEEMWSLGPDDYWYGGYPFGGPFYGDYDDFEDSDRGYFDDRGFAGREFDQRELARSEEHREAERREHQPSMLEQGYHREDEFTRGNFDRDGFNRRDSDRDDTDRR